MQAVIWAGSAITLIGVALLGWCVRLGVEARRTATQDEAAGRAALTRVLAWNMAALGVAGIGLMMVVVGLVLR
jgi:hypothetical protein